MKLIYLEDTLNYMIKQGKEKEADKLVENSDHFEGTLGNYIVVKNELSNS